MEAPLLDCVNSPSDLKAFDKAKLEKLALEIRNYIIEVVAKTGGHLASNLGVVELTLALHYVFNSPIDKIIWDVGHQCYTHKILTGRKQEMTTLRQYQGLSGFPKRSESIHDIVETGHSSTSLSSALGLALARDNADEKNDIIAVIGDGALTGGMALEALNYIGHQKRKLIIILNDNEMSIAPNVGGLASYLDRLRSEPAYYKLKEDVEYILKKIPAIGGSMVKVMERVRGSLKYLVLQGRLFEEMGLQYMGPVNGHNLSHLCNYLKKARGVNGPVLLHVLTKKGKGYAPAEENPNIFHGTGPFEVATGLSLKQKTRPTYTQVFSKSLTAMAKEQQDIVAITAAMPEGTGLSDFAHQYPQRFFDVGIAEQQALAMAGGLARGGLKPIVAIYSTFLQRAYDQIIHDICMPNLPVVLAIDRGGLVGDDGETHHGVFDLSFLRSIPNLTVAAPRDGIELTQMLKHAFKANKPYAIRYPRGVIPLELDIVKSTTSFEQAELIREGTDLLIIAIGSMVYPALKVAQALNQINIRVGVLDLRFIKPLDEKTVQKNIEDSKMIVTIEENVIQGGMGSAILELMSQANITKPILNIGFKDSFITHGSIDLLLKANEMDEISLQQRILRFYEQQKFNKGGWPPFEKKIRHAVGGKGAFYIEN